MIVQRFTVDRYFQAVRCLILPSLLLITPQSAQAHGILPFAVEMLQTTGIVVTSASRCVTFTYDKNGNRQAQSTSMPASEPVTWGAGQFGCFVWHS